MKPTSPTCLVALLLALAAPCAESAITTAPVASVTPTIALAPMSPQAQSRRYGPYPTMRKANEVANWFRRQGFQAVAFHNGDGYYVNVW